MIFLHKMNYFAEKFYHSKNEIKLELDLSNHETKYNEKNTTGVDKSKFAKEDDLANLKSEFDNLDFGKT